MIQTSQTIFRALVLIVVVSSVLFHRKKIRSGQSTHVYCGKFSAKAAEKQNVQSADFANKCTKSTCGSWCRLLHYGNSHNGGRQNVPTGSADKPRPLDQTVDGWFCDGTVMVSERKGLCTSDQGL